MSRQGKIGILATTGTFGSRRYQQLLARFGRGVLALEDPCLGLVEEIEAGRLDEPAARAILGRAIRPMLAAGVDTLVLGCTHYPFVQPLVQELAGPAVTIIDPAPAVARQVQRVLADVAPTPSPDPRTSPLQAYTTADPARFVTLADRLLGYPLPTAGVRWTPGGRLEPAPADAR
jgi:glutamate racemase